MSSPSSDRYQSRFFNFINRQSRRFQQQCDRAFHTLQASASWVAAVGLYPLLLFKSSRWTNKQLHQTVKQIFRQLSASVDNTESQTPPTVDTPIQQVMLCIDISPTKALLPDLSIRGIATQLSSQTLVLVTPQNQLLDILTQEHQQKLQEQIIVAVADYWRYQRLSYSLKSSAINPDNSQTHANTITTLIWAAVDYFFGNQRKKNLTYIPSSQSLESIDAPLQEKQLQGRHTVTKLSASKSRSAQLPASVHLDQNIEDPWLNESDLFGDSIAAIEMPQQLKSPTIESRTKKTSLLPSIKIVGYSLQNLVNSWRKYSPAQLTSGIAKQQKINTGKLSDRLEQSLPLSQSPQQLETDKTSTPAYSQTGVKLPPDWIETHATVIGYVKHPLEQLLTWLDQAMLWLEEVLLKFWHWLQKWGYKV